MTRASLRFPCPQCLSWLQAPQTAAGTRRRCPRCQFVLKVPLQSRTRGNSESYSLAEGEGPAEQPAYVTVVCPVCQTRMYATPEQIGQEITCPDCGRATAVPPPGPPPQPRAAPPTVEEYLLCEEVEGSSDVDRLGEPTIRVYCGVCGTMMYASEAEVGQQLVCPDCGVSMVVRRPDRPPKKPPRSAGEIGEYPLAAEAPAGGAGLPAGPGPNAPFVAIVCTVCHTRLHATLEQVGGRMVCPDCGATNIIPPPPPPPRKIDVMDGAADGYRVSAEPSPPPAAMPQRAPVQSGTQLEPHPRRPVLPPRPFVTGTFDFPFTCAWGNAIRLSIWALLCLGSAVTGGAMIAAGESFAVIVGVLLATVAIFLSIGCITFATGCAIAVLRDTANGCDEIQNWPGIGFLDWMGEPLYVVSAILVSVFPGVALRWLPPEYGAANVIVPPLGLFLLFPFVLLSMLENGSPIDPISWPVCRTLWRSWKGWASFYLVTASLLVTAAVLAIAASAAGPLYGLFALPVIGVIVWLIYFRLLGRLAWYCAEKDRAVEADDDQEDDEEFDDDSHEDRPPLVRAS